MTIDRLHLAELIEKGSDADLLREMMSLVVRRMMDLDVESITGAAYGERSEGRVNQRNDYRERPWHTAHLFLSLDVRRFGRRHFGAGRFGARQLCLTAASVAAGAPLRGRNPMIRRLLASRSG